MYVNGYQLWGGGVNLSRDVLVNVCSDFRNAGAKMLEKLFEGGPCSATQKEQLCTGELLVGFLILSSKIRKTSLSARWWKFMLILLL